MASFGYLYSYSIICLILYVCQFTLVVSVPVEPVCSKFSYDEQLLEKMVRIEFFVENMKKDVDKSVSNFEDKLIDIQANNSNTFSEQQEKINNLELQTGNLEVQTGVFADTMANKSTVSENTKNLMKMKSDMGNIKQELKESSSSIDGLKRVAVDINTKYRDGLSDLSKKVIDLEKQIKDLSQLTKKSQVVAFNAMDAVSYTGSDAINFKDVILNKGGAFNKDTGIFTAPVDGIYQFNAQICSVKGSDIEYFIKVDKKSIITGEFRVPNAATDLKCISFSAIGLVRKAERVHVGGMSYEKIREYSNDDLCSFSGTLVQIL